MRSNVQILINIILFLTSCRQQQVVKGKIFERREINDKRLMIKYSYSADNKIYIDSAIIKNLIIADDSIDIIIDPAHPGVSLPDFPK